MDLVLQLFGYLILTFLAITVPLFGILLSVFREGISKLKTQYENEKSNYEKNIQDQLKRQAEAKKPNVQEIKKSIKDLESIKKETENKLSYLNPKRQILKLFSMLLISFLGIMFSILTKTNIYYLGISIFISIVFFFAALYVLWKLLGITVEVKEIIDEGRKDTEVETMELLSIISQQSPVLQIPPEEFFLRNVYLQIDGKDIRAKGTSIILTPDATNSIKLSLINLETRMTKNVEVGLRFPHDFMIKKNTSYNIFTYEDGRQIVRYKIEDIQGDTEQLLQSLNLTPINAGEYTIDTWIKSENIEPTYIDVLFNVVSVGPR